MSYRQLIRNLRLRAEVKKAIKNKPKLSPTPYTERENTLHFDNGSVIFDVLTNEPYTGPVIYIPSTEKLIMDDFKPEYNNTRNVGDCNTTNDNSPDSGSDGSESGSFD